MISSKCIRQHNDAKYSTLDFERIFIEWEYIKVQKNIINEASEAGRDHVNPPKGGILIGVITVN